MSTFEQHVNALGLPTPSFVPDRRIGDNTVGLVRTDWLINDANTLTLRGDYRSSSQDPSRNSPYALPSNTGLSETEGAGLAATLTSLTEGGIINELRAYYTGDKNDLSPYLYLPSGRVRINTLLADGTQGINTVSFGGNAGFPQNGHTSLLEAADEVSYLSKDRAHRVRFGTLLDISRFTQSATTNQLGTFTYNSLESFLNDTPDSYTRTLNPQDRLGATTAGAIYLGDTWRPRQGMQLVYGLRAEGTHVGDPPALNPAVQQTFGFRTNLFPSEIHVSPRVGFTANLSHPDPNDPFAQFQPAFVLRGGIGEFRAKTPTGLYTSAQAGTGLPNTQQQLTCIGPQVPTPDWASYYDNPTSAPTACLPDVSAPPGFGAARTAVTVFDPDFEAPRSWRGSLGLQHRLWANVTGSADLSYARGVSLYGVRDLNLNTTPAFTLADENNRPVYVPPNTIVPGTGQTSSNASRLHPEFGPVYELTSGLHSDTRQLTLSMTGSTAGGTTFFLAYTLQRTLDNSSFANGSAALGFSSPTTAGNPNVTEWGPGDMDMRHSIQGYMTKPINSWMEITANGRLTSGTPFTPLVSGDINGDGSRNDRAFIFNPATTADPAVASAMKALIDGAPARIRDCLTSQLGEVAARNSCRGPWTPSLDMQANFHPDGWGMHHHMTFSLVASNVLAGLDQMLHGSNLRGWGQFNRTDPTLLYVKGFDPVKNEFIYDVNGRFGQNNATTLVYRQPFVLSLQARLVLGPDPRDRFRQIFAARTDTSATNAAAVQNPVAQVIQMRDTLGLTDDQVAKLNVVSDTLASQTKAIAAVIRAQVQKNGGSNPQAIMSSIRPQITQGRKDLADAMAQVKTILTPAQWAKVPDSVKNPPAFGGLGGGGRRGGGPDR